jgi:orotate phosphoribosyltransferase
MDSQTIAAKTAAYLLQIQAVKLSPQQPFTWASGIQSPIYCDNRLTLSYCDVRNYIKNSFATIIQEKYPAIDIIAGVATGGIAHGALVADLLQKPFIYVRSSAKAHGLGNMVEGDLKAGDRVLVIEDLISTGGSSLAAVESLRQLGADIVGLGAIFTYGFQRAVDAFAAANCPYFTLSNYATILDIALKNQYIAAEEIENLTQWYKAPESWTVDKNEKNIL